MREQIGVAAWKDTRMPGLRSALQATNALVGVGLVESESVFKYFGDDRSAAWKQPTKQSIAGIKPGPHLPAFPMIGGRG